MSTKDALIANEVLLAPAWTLIDEVPRADMAVVVRHGLFADVGAALEVAARHPHLQSVPLPDRLLMPGFVDAHHHLTQSFGKALAFGEPSEIYRRIWVPLERHLDAEALYVSAKLAALEALRGGFTTVCDAGTRSTAGIEAIASAASEAGVRCVLAVICNDIGLDDAATKAVLGTGERHLATRTADGLIHPSLAVSVPELARDNTLGRVYKLCAEADAAFQVHVNEHLVAVERSLVDRGLRPLEHLARAGALGPQTLAAHCTLVTPVEIAMLRDTGTGVSYNPVASSWKGNAVAPANLMATFGIRLGLGTDATRSNGFRLMDAAETAQRLAFGIPTGDSSTGSGWRWLAMASSGGADVARLGHRTGRIATGLAADYLLIDVDVPELTPSWDLGWELVRLADRSQIEAVVVQGRLRLWQGWPIDWDARALMRDADRIARRAVAAAPIQRVHSTSAERRG
ncbi:MAG: amidohydrolase family protein [Burkholderiales bacterium]